MNTKPAGFLLVILSVFACGEASAAEPVIGAVARMQGAATGTSEGVTENLAAGAAVRLNETVATAAASRLELAFEDGTRLTVGEKAMVVLDRFVYEPAGASVFHASVAGPFRFISGKLAAGASRQASVTTPYALIGIRGTDFWGGPIDNAFGVFLLEGVITVSAGGQEVTLSAPGSGTNLPAGGGPPGDVTTWPADKAARALATVTFQ